LGSSGCACTGIVTDSASAIGSGAAFNVTITDAAGGQAGGQYQGIMVAAAAEPSLFAHADSALNLAMHAIRGRYAVGSFMSRFALIAGVAGKPRGAAVTVVAGVPGYAVIASGAGAVRLALPAVFPGMVLDTFATVRSCEIIVAPVTVESCVSSFALIAVVTDKVIGAAVADNTGPSMVTGAGRIISPGTGRDAVQTVDRA